LPDEPAPPSSLPLSRPLPDLEAVAPAASWPRSEQTWRPASVAAVGGTPSRWRPPPPSVAAMPAAPKEYIRVRGFIKPRALSGSAGCLSLKLEPADRGLLCSGEDKAVVDGALLERTCRARHGVFGGAECGASGSKYYQRFDRFDSSAKPIEWQKRPSRLETVGCIQARVILASFIKSKRLSSYLRGRRPPCGTSPCVSGYAAV